MSVKLQSCENLKNVQHNLKIYIKYIIEIVLNYDYYDKKDNIKMYNKI